MSYTLERTVPEAVGIDSNAIIDFIDAAAEQNIAMHSLMVLRHGKAAAELYWEPYCAQSLNHVYSFSKTLTSAAIGFAVDEGLISYDDRLCSFFPRYVDSGADEQIFSVTIEHLLTMTSGMVLVNEISAVMKDDWVRFFLNSDLSSFPGDRFCYNSLNTYMLAAVLRKVSGVGLVDYLTPRLFEPLGIKDIYSDKCPMGRDIGGWGIHIKTEDMAKFGQLLLMGGKLGDKQILPAKWVERSIQPHSDPRDDSKFPDSGDCSSGYGYQIWINRDEKSFRADGMLGQFAVVLPELDSVVVTTAGCMDEYDVLNLIWDKIIPAIGSVPETDSESESYQTLKAKASSLSVVDTNPSVVSILTYKYNGKEYIMPPNIQSVFPFMVRYSKRSMMTGIESFSFHFGDECSMSWIESDTEYTVPLVFDGKFTKISVPFFDSDIPCSVYSFIRESSPGKYELEVILAFTDTPHSSHLLFTFEKDELTVKFNELPDYVDFVRFASDIITSYRNIPPQITKALGKIAEVTLTAKADDDEEN